MPGVGIGLGFSITRTNLRAVESPSHAFDDLLAPFEELVGEAHRIDDETAALIVGAAKARAPQGDTGALVNGIAAGRDGDTRTVEAHAVAPDGVDYAAIVEGGRPAHADASYFAGDGAHALNTVDTNKGAMPAQPFFYPASAEPLSQRFRNMLAALGRYFDKAGFDG